MTSDYKNILLNYFTGNLNQEQKDNIPQFGEIEVISNNLKTFIENNIDGTFRASGRKFIQGKDGNNNDMDMFVFIGEEGQENDVVYGFMVVLDTDMKPLQIIKNFTSNVRIGRIGAIQVANDGTFYAVERSTETGNWRLLLLNNILAKKTDEEYFCKIRVSYSIPKAVNNYDFEPEDIFKSPTGSNYGLLCRVVADGTIPSNYIVAKNLKIEVGTSPEWTEYSSATTNFSYITSYWTWDSENNYYFQIFGYYSDNKNIHKYYLNNSSMSLQSYDISSYAYTGGFLKCDASVVNDTLFYIGITTAESDSLQQRNVKYLILKCLNDTMTNIFQKNVVTTLNSPWDRFVFYKKDSIVFFREYYPIDDHFNLDVGLISNDNAYYFTIDSITSTATSLYYAYKSFVVTIQYNLIKYYIPSYSYNSVYRCEQIYNANQYNGQPYTNVNSLVPNSVVLFNNDEEPKTILARNLYNKQVNNNTTVATVQVPNTLLNNETIKNKSLYGETNYVLTYDLSEITKNIYETLNINFFNTLIMKNSNDPDNEIINTIGATRINTSVSEETDYDYAKCCKTRINYEDNTTKVNTISWYPVGNYYRVNVLVYVDKDVHSIDFISNDETTVYNTINPTLNVNKYYVIKQDVYIDNKIEPDALYYGDDELYYNDEPIYY